MAEEATCPFCNEETTSPVAHLVERHPELAGMHPPRCACGVAINDLFKHLYEAAGTSFLHLDSTTREARQAVFSHVVEAALVGGIE